MQSKRDGLADYLRSHEHPGGIIVCEQSKFIYMKPSKTAGSSILRSKLEKEVSGIFHYKDNPGPFEKWIERITDEQLEDYYIFAVVRNPWDRLVSISSYFEIPFNDFVQNIQDYWRDEEIRIHSLPQSIYTHVEGVAFVDFVCRFECLQPDINLVSDHLAWKEKNYHWLIGLSTTIILPTIPNSILRKWKKFIKMILRISVVHLSQTWIKI